MTCCITEEEELKFIGAFDNVAIAMLRLFVLLSTENYPVFMLPALRYNLFNFFYFGTFVFVGVFFITAILLAVIVDSYWLDAKKHVKRRRARERAELAKAWNILDPSGHGAIEVHDEKFVNVFRKLKPKNSDEQNIILINILDRNQDGFIDSYEWMTMLRQALDAEFEETSEDIIFNNTRSMSTYEKLQEKARNIIENEIFSRIILILIFVHVILFTLKWKGQNVSIILLILVLRSLILVLFMMESLIKIIGLGKKLLRQLELMDIILVLLATIFNFLCYFCMETLYYNLFTVFSSVCVFLRLFLNSAQTRHALRWFLNIAPVMVDLVILLVISLYLLAVFGMELFQGYSSTKGEFIKSAYSEQCGIGFDTFSCSLLMLFQVLSTSNWHDVMNSVRVNTGREWTVLYFIFVYIVITMVIMNLFVAIAIEAANKLGHSIQDLKKTVNQDPKKQKKSLKNKAATAIQSFANSFFGTARIEDLSQRNEILHTLSNRAAFTGMKRKRTSTSIILKQPRGRRKKISVLKLPTSFVSSLHKDHWEIKNMTVVDEYDSVTDVLEPTRLTAKEKRQQKMKNRMKMRREQHIKKRIEEKMEMLNELKTEEVEGNSNLVLHETRQKARVVTSYKATEDNQLVIEEGDIISILDRINDWIYADLNGKIGWIPASHVSTGTKLPTHQIVLSKSSGLSNGSDEMVVTHTGSAINAFPPRSNSKHKVKMKRAGDWTRDILGEITVMNAEEMRELNKVMKAEIRGLSVRKNQISPPPKRPECFKVNAGNCSDVLSENVGDWEPDFSTNKAFFQDSSVAKNNLFPDPSAAIINSAGSPVPLLVSVEPVRTPSPPASPVSLETDIDHLKLKPSNIMKNKPKTTKNSLPPDWLKRLAVTNNMAISDDAKINSDEEQRTHQNAKYDSDTLDTFQKFSMENDAGKSSTLAVPVALESQKSRFTFASSLTKNNDLNEFKSRRVSPHCWPSATDTFNNKINIRKPKPHQRGNLNVPHHTEQISDIPDSLTAKADAVETLIVKPALLQTSQVSSTNGNDGMVAILASENQRSFTEDQISSVMENEKPVQEITELTLISLSSKDESFEC